MNKLNNVLAALALLAGGCCTALPALAQSANLNAWTPAGDVRVDSASGATLTTAAVESGETPLTAKSALQYFDLEPALALDAGALPADTFEGSGLAQTFSVGAGGSTVSFGWALSTVGYTPSQADRAFVVVDGGTLVNLGTAAASTVAGSFSRTFAVGNHALAILVMDVNAYDGVSTLALSNFRVSAVPEPSTLAALLAGLCVVAGAKRGLRTRCAIATAAPAA